MDVPAWSGRSYSPCACQEVRSACKGVAEPAFEEAWGETLSIHGKQLGMACCSCLGPHQIVRMLSRPHLTVCLLRQPCILLLLPPAWIQGENGAASQEVLAQRRPTLTKMSFLNVKQHPVSLARRTSAVVTEAHAAGRDSKRCGSFNNPIEDHLALPPPLATRRA